MKMQLYVDSFIMLSAAGNDRSVIERHVVVQDKEDSLGPSENDNLYTIYDASKPTDSNRRNKKSKTAQRVWSH
jgi:hypothetical protein